MSVSFAWWWCIGLLPLPWMIRLLPASAQSANSIFYPFTDAIQNTRIPTFYFSKILALLGWLCLVAALTRPQVISELQTANQDVRNLVVAVDISESMLENDMLVAGKRTTRLEALKIALNEFIQKRRGNQIGIVVFADNAYVQSPLSFDTASITQLVNGLRVGLAGRRTAIGDALVLSVKLIDNNPLATKENASIIFLSDGTNTWGKVTPQEAIALVNNSGYTVYTIGFGGRGFTSGLDEQTLRQIANSSGGAYFRATNTNELIQVYSLLDQLTSVEVQTWNYQKRVELYWWFLLVALIAVVLATISYLYLDTRIANIDKPH